MVSSGASLEQLCVNTVRGLAIDAVQKAESGHPGMPLGTAPMAFVLWDRFLKHSPSDPHWFDRDRFVLSAGHGSMLIYSFLHLFGYDLSLDDIKQFRQWGSKTPGHPENHLTPGVEMATGPLGQGISTAVGMAMAERLLTAKFNEGGRQVVSHFTYVLASDGDLMEGVAQEACSVAGHQKLGRLIVLYDSNDITIDGSTQLAYTEDTPRKFAALGWHVAEVDGMDTEQVAKALAEAQAVTDRPSLIVAKTTIGFGSPNKAGSASSHGSPLGKDEVALTKRSLGLPEADFYVPQEAVAYCRTSAERGEQRRREWLESLNAWRTEDPNSYEEFQAAVSGTMPSGWDACLPNFDKPIATRNASHSVLNAIAKAAPTLVSGCADLAGSVKTTIKEGGDMQASSPLGRNVNYGVREHGMAAIVNGMTLHGGVRAIGGTFLIFSDYCRPSLRLAGLMRCPSIFLFSHDSIGLGEDGPTHQPVEQAMSLRMIPNFNVMRPADGNETAVCWKIAMESKETPCALLLTRQDVPAVAPSPSANHPAQKGAYVLAESASELKIVIAATGSEVGLAIEAQKALAENGVGARVVSMPSWFLFELQKAEYRKSVFPNGVPVLSIEAGTTLGWGRYADASIGLDRFGASAPAERLFEEFGFTVENAVKKALALL